MKKIFLKILVIFSLLCLIHNNIFAVKPLEDYIIENYDIDMVVNEDNTFDITEKITTYFDIPKHRNI